MAALIDVNTTGGMNPGGAGYSGPPNVTGSPTVDYGDKKPVVTDGTALQTGPTLAEQVAANLAALGYLNSPLADTTTRPTVVIQQAKSNTMLWVLLILGAMILAYWYMKKHGQL